MIYNKKYISLSSDFWHRAPKTLGISLSKEWEGCFVPPKDGGAGCLEHQPCDERVRVFSLHPQPLGRRMGLEAKSVASDVISHACVVRLP